MSLHVDYLIGGAGAMGMAFADVILHETTKPSRLRIGARPLAVIGMMLTRLFGCINPAFYGVNSRTRRRPDRQSVEQRPL